MKRTRRIASGVVYWSNQGVCASERSPWVQRYEADCHDPVPVADVLGVLH